MDEAFQKSKQIGTTTNQNIKHQLILASDDKEYLNKEDADEYLDDVNGANKTNESMIKLQNLHSSKEKKNCIVLRSICGRWTSSIIKFGLCLLILILAILLVHTIQNITSTNKNQSISESTSATQNNIHDNVDIDDTTTKITPTTDFYIKSTAFDYGQSIPDKYASSISPPLQWSNIPTGTKSFVLLMNDPDAPDPANPQMVWIHWLVYDIPANITSFEEGPITNIGQVARNDWEKTQYDGPAPPIGKHRYYIKLYALDTLFGDLGPDAEWELIEDRVKQHQINVSEYMGTYEKDKP